MWLMLRKKQGVMDYGVGEIGQTWRGRSSTSKDAS